VGGPVVDSAEHDQVTGLLLADAAVMAVMDL
jgi:hypothetical protein